MTDALTRFADAAVQAALASLCAAARERGQLAGGGAGDDPSPGLFCLALGKHGAGS